MKLALSLLTKRHNRRADFDLSKILLKLLIMIRSALILIFLLGFVETSLEQVITVSQELIIKNDNDIHIFGKYGNNTLLFRDRDQHYEIQSFNERMGLGWSRDLQFESRTVKVLNVVPHKEHFSIIYQVKVKKNWLVKIIKYDSLLM